MDKDKKNPGLSTPEIVGETFEIDPDGDLLPTIFPAWRDYITNRARPELVAGVDPRLLRQIYQDLFLAMAGADYFTLDGFKSQLAEDAPILLPPLREALVKNMAEQIADQVGLEPMAVTDFQDETARLIWQVFPREAQADPGMCADLAAGLLKEIDNGTSNVELAGFTAGFLEDRGFPARVARGSRPMSLVNKILAMLDEAGILCVG